MFASRALRAGLGLVLATAMSASAAIAPVGATTTTCVPGSHACPIRIMFAPGAFSGQAHSTLTGMSSQRWFVARLRAGQTLIAIVEGRGPTRGWVYFPNGASNGQSGGRIYDGSAPVSGDYRFKVTESPMGSAWSGRVDLLIVVY